MLTRFNRVIVAVSSGVTASLLLAASAAGQGRPVVVYAEPDENIRTERISYADLDLAQQRAERILRMRVAKAVRRVCLFDHSDPGLQDSSYYSCANEAKAGAAPQIANAVERARQLAMTGRSSIAASSITIAVAAR